ncbi:MULTISPECIES: hypothetical protein [Thermoactinomyces]|uniref:Uncharacterized protein n=1 Tax=Thermoactinomyces daqus TaxID=1329516 RepID=A0A7W1XCF3_9BACL|nr:MULTISPECIES: hypothetical protein [Thermoactinomyces]MBA4544075.1 hypothetical protein [Thermoactinomyces daqus]MBH8598212.1 hypothetical protein [Thermoactinomyces sp. CICC 10523]MBH8603241.1 hypothetical protein [Thermoactinomyces sp. CICC 10522]MBH8608603.1 hypothetical protein [Thermoactinomyces sp. CICC 10521]
MNHFLTPEQEKQIRALIDELLPPKNNPVSVQVQMPSRVNSVLAELTNNIPGPGSSSGILGVITNGFNSFLNHLAKLFSNLVEILGPDAVNQLFPGLVNVIYKEVPIEQMKKAAQPPSQTE